MTKIADADREKIISHVLAELSAGVPISRTLGPDRDEWLCCERAFWNWYYEADADDPNDLVQKVARARQCGIEAKMDHAMRVAETPMIGEIKVEKFINVGGELMPATEIRHEDMIGHRRLVVDTIHKQAQMLKPKTYGPKFDVTSGGERIGDIDEATKMTRLASLVAAIRGSDESSDNPG